MWQMPGMHHFLLVYGYDEGRLVERDEFDDADVAAAMYTAKEREYVDRPRYEIVLLGSDSIETIMKTHGHYFAGSDTSLFSDFLAAS